MKLLPLRWLAPLRVFEVTTVGCWSSPRSVLRWLLPLCAFLVGVIWGLSELYWTNVLVKYRQSGGESCLLARGYAREFELKEGRKPDMTELREWALKRFREDMEKVVIDEDFHVVKKSAPLGISSKQ